MLRGRVRGRKRMKKLPSSARSSVGACVLGLRVFSHAISGRPAPMPISIAESPLHHLWFAALVSAMWCCSPSRETSLGGHADASSDDDGKRNVMQGSSTGSTNSAGRSAAAEGSNGEPAAQVYLLLGQSNMWGVSPPEEQDRTINPSIEVMALTTCDGQAIGEWYPASPPLHGCVGVGKGNPGVGPGDTFAKTIAEAYPEDTILLVPNAIPGESIDTFLPGEPAYTSIISRAKKAQQRGIIRGIIFHQGESDTGQETWLDRVEAMIETLRADLAIASAPFVAAELPYAGCCGKLHNPIINRLPERVADSHVVSSAGLAIMDDGLHFDTPANRELGRRYARVMLPLLER